MALLHEFNEENVSEAEAATYKVRKAVRAIVFDADNNVGIINLTTYKYYDLPGGGIEEGETPEEACIRECKEEIGCTVEIVTELGSTREYRQQLGRINESICFIAKVAGEKGLPALTETEIANGTETVWVPLEEAIRLVKASTYEKLYDKYVVQRSQVFLAALKQK
ncbi:MAG: NUDIX domain-containing protein [Patescibacteria group bacterium]